MAIGLVGRKCGMTRVFTLDGLSVPVAVVEVEPNIVTQVKTFDNDGYHAIQVTVGERRASKVTKPLAGHYAKAKVAPGRCLLEFRLPKKTNYSAEHEGVELKIGVELTVKLFKEGQKIDVRGVSKGKGFAGVVKRHNFSCQDMTHGNSLSHRAPGSIGQNQSPGRVFKGKKMAGRLGGQLCAVQNLEIIRVDEEKNLLLIKGAIPGAPGGDIVILPACKENVKKENNDGA